MSTFDTCDCNDINRHGKVRTCVCKEKKCLPVVTVKDPSTNNKGFSISSNEKRQHRNTQWDCQKTIAMDNKAK